MPCLWERLHQGNYLTKLTHLLVEDIILKL